MGTKEKDKKFVILPCDCHCCMMVVERIEWDDGDIDYNIAVQDSYYDHNYNTILGRLKRAAKALFGKPIYYNDVYITEPAKFRQWVDSLVEMSEQDREATSAQPETTQKKESENS